MLNLLSYVGMSLQSELCLWTMLGLCRTVFDATLFKVNANLKQVWQMSMPSELTMPVQRVLRTMISGVMLVQCFTVYVYLASYIVLLYPVFLEERPTLVLPWLLLAAIRKFLCEFTSLALGLGACVLLGPARPPCIKFVVIKIATISPAFYMWMLVFSYYHTLKVTSAFKTFAAVLPSSDLDDGLELAVRRRRTKSLFGEEELRKKLVSSFNYGARQSIETTYLKSNISSRMVHSTDTNLEDIEANFDHLQPIDAISERILSETGSYEDWCGNEVIVPRDTDRILEQFVLMLLRVSAYLQAESGTDPAKLFSLHVRGARFDNIECTAPGEDTDTPPQVGNSKRRTASYLQEYPQIFMKRTDTLQIQDLNSAHNQVENDDGVGNIKSQSHTQSVVFKTSSETIDRRKIIDREIPIIESSSNFIFKIRSNESNTAEDFNLKDDEDTDSENSSKRQTRDNVPEIYRKLSSDDSLKLSILKQLQSSKASHSKDPKAKDNNREKVESDISEASSVASLDSLQSVINSMKKNPPQNKKSLKYLKQDQNQRKTGI